LRYQLESAVGVVTIERPILALSAGAARNGLREAPSPYIAAGYPFFASISLTFAATRSVPAVFGVATLLSQHCEIHAFSARCPFTRRIMQPS
jgi:hypothetical protein